MFAKRRIENGPHPQGDENLEIMRFAPRYVSHIAQLVAGWLPEHGSLIELGSGDGIQTSQIIKPTNRLTCVEQSSQRREMLAQLGYSVHSRLEDSVGSEAACLFSLNCLEHIEDDVEMMRTANSALAPNGRVIIYVPAMPSLYSTMDEHVGHFRRYTKKTLTETLTAAGFVIERIQFVDTLGVFPSFVYKLLPNSNGEPSPASMAIYDKYFFPVSRFFDKVLFRWFGKNLLIIGRKLS